MILIRCLQALWRFVKAAVLIVFELSGLPLRPGDTVGYSIVVNFPFTPFRS